MAFKTTIDLNREFIVSADINTVFSLLADVPASISHFPKLQALIPLTENSFRWEMEEISSAGYSNKVIYACQYEVDNENKTVVWTPVKGEGNGIVSGKFELKQLENGTNVVFSTTAELTLPFSRLLKAVINPFVKSEFTVTVDTFLRNLKELWA